MTSLAARIVYTSRSGITDSYYPVTGAVFVPKGDPPAGGWPMVAFGHRATGIRSQCAPSYSPTLLGESATVIELVKAGYVVTVPDYQGLGLDKTYHPFLDSTTEGYNLIDSIGAVRKLVPDTSRKWIAFGIGQGGQAAWAANELVENHGLSLNLLGAVSVSPIADIDGLADAAAAGALTTDQKLTLQAFLAALENTYGKDVSISTIIGMAVRRRIGMPCWRVTPSRVTNAHSSRSRSARTTYGRAAPTRWTAFAGSCGRRHCRKARQVHRCWLSTVDGIR